MKKSTASHIAGRMNGAQPMEQERFARLVESLAIPAIEWRPDGIISGANPEFCGLVGYEKSELLGQSIYTMLFPGELSDQWDEARLSFSMGRDIDHYVAEVRHKDGSRKVVSWTSVAHFEPSGLLLRILCLGFDITPLAVAQRRITKLARLMSGSLASSNGSR